MVRNVEIKRIGKLRRENYSRGVDARCTDTLFPLKPFPTLRRIVSGGVEQVLAYAGTDARISSEEICESARRASAVISRDGYPPSGDSVPSPMNRAAYRTVMEIHRLRENSSVRCHRFAESAKRAS